MGASFSADEIIEIAGGRLAAGLVPDCVAGIATDTRSAVDDCWFVALRGSRYDGHDFLGDAFSGGAVGCIVEERQSYPIASTSYPLIAVSDTMKALADLGRTWKERSNLVVIAIAGESADCSTLVSRLAYRLFAAHGPADLIEVHHQGLRGCFEQLFETGPETGYVILNLVVSSLEQLDLLGRGFAPDVLVLVGKPFDYLRITAAEAGIREATKTLLSGVQTGGGDIYWACESGLVSSFVSQSRGLSVYSVPAREDIETADAEKEKVEDFSVPESGHIEFECRMVTEPVPTGQEHKHRELWCVRSLCRQFGVPDGRLEEFLGDPLFA
ncbi:MAG: hypothetical protein IPM23_01480 [Candidatus Melainabacteria bacterium]|nr:hypothetical protein [Candidatus Melainabacteria bacterium]